MKIETPILRRLGPVPFWRGELKCLDELERIYRRAAAHAEAALHPPADAGAAGQKARPAG
ncbi:MAG: hypothetical protein J6T51_00960 [Kiritimatiellae bacterium]|nr:hypothetical protein [Kiritimatiellia bacterium]